MDFEKRQHERFDVSQDVEISLPDGSAVMTRSLNISESGLFCRSGKEIQEGTVVKFSLLIPGKKNSINVDCEGNVLRCTANGPHHDIVILFTD